MCADTLPTTQDRIVFLGDSITDGGTMMLMIGQAICDAGKPAPTLINAGIAGDTSAGMLKRLKRDVLAHRPTIVCVSAGINDLMRNVKPEAYAKNIDGIVKGLQERKVRVVVLTLTPVGSKHEAKQAMWQQYNTILRGAATRYGCAVAEVARDMTAGPGSPDRLLSDDHIHLGFDGYIKMAGAVLHALGYARLSAPRDLRIEQLPGIIAHWKFRALGKGEKAPTEEDVKALKADGTWKDYSLPEQRPRDSWWLEHERRRGLGLSMEKLIGPAKEFVGVAKLESAEAREVWVNVGAQLQAVFLNGVKIYQNKGWRGWHPGKEAVRVRLKKGANQIVVVVPNQWFLSVTDRRQL